MPFLRLVQLVECTNCGNQVSIPYNPVFDSLKQKMPWEVWPTGCPKCGGKKVDVTVVADKSGKITDARRVS